MGCGGSKPKADAAQLESNAKPIIGQPISSAKTPATAPVTAPETKVEPKTEAPAPQT